jgi:hypothetical protein
MAAASRSSGSAAAVTPAAAWFELMFEFYPGHRSAKDQNRNLWTTTPKPHRRLIPPSGVAVRSRLNAPYTIRSSSGAMERV